MGKDWQDSKRSIVDATGASGKALDGLMQSYRGVQGTVAASNAQISKAIGDLNTHTKRAGPGLEQLATKALKAGLNTDTLGKSIKSFNVTGGEQERLIDKLVTLGQSYGANINQLQTDIGRYKGDLDALGLSMDQQITLAALAQSENQKLRNVVRELEDGTGGWREKLAQAVPALSGVAGATERAYEDGKTWGQSLTELRGKLEGMVGPMSQVAAGAGGLVSGFAAAATAFPGMAGRIVSALKLVTTGSRTMWLSLTGVGLLAAAGAAMWGFRDKVASLLASLIEMVGNGINRLLAIAHGMAEKLGLDSLADGILRAANAVSQGTSDATKALRTYARSFEDEAIPAAREYAGILGSGATGGNSASVTGALRATTEETRQAVTETEKLTRSFQNVAPAVGDWNTAISRSVMLIESRPLLLLRSDINSTQLASQALAVSLGKTNKVVAATGPTWGDTLRSGLASTWTVENVSQTIMGAFQGGGGLLGGIQALGTQMGGTLAQSLQSKLSGLTSNMGGVLETY